MMSLFIKCLGVITFLVFFSPVASQAGQEVVACYLQSWAAYRLSSGAFHIEDIEPELCTHLLYGNLGLNDTTWTITPRDKWLDLEENFGKGGYKKAVDLKEVNPNLKVLVSMGGWVDGSVKYSTLAGDLKKKRAFVGSAVEFLRRHRLDGLNMDWQFPTMRDGKPEDKDNFVEFMKDLKEAFSQHNLLLTAFFSPKKEIMRSAYDVANLSKYLDLMFISTYTYHGFWDGVVGANAPFRVQNKKDTDSVENTIDYLLSQGAPPKKLVMGLSTGGRTFLLKEPATREIIFGQATVHNNGFQGKFTKEDGYISYFEVCQEKSGSIWRGSQWKQLWDEKSLTPYIRKDDQIITYDNSRSIAIKVKSAIDRGLGGVYLYSLDTDDFRGECELETDTFFDYQKLLNKLSTQATTDAADNYLVDDCRIRVNVPKRKTNKFPILRTIHDAIKVSKAMKKVVSERTM